MSHPPSRLPRRAPLPLALGLLFGPLCSGCGETPPAPADADEPAMECPPGTPGCPCDTDETCEEDLVCHEGTCQGSRSEGIEVTDQAARSCEVLLLETNTEILDVELSAGVRGTHVREAPRTAVSFVRTEDAAFDGIPLTVRSVDQGEVTIARAECFDARGTSLGGEGVVLR